MNHQRQISRILIPAIFMILSFEVMAQSVHERKNNWSFHSYTGEGILAGEKGPAFQLQTVNGVSYKTWFAGIGIGLDYYQFRSVPLFIDLKKSFPCGSLAIFGYTDGGISFSWVTAQQHGFSESQFSNGFYGDFGLGLQVPLGKPVKFFCSFGYSLKQSKEQNNSINYCPIAGACVSNSSHISYDLNRFLVKAGINF